VYPIALLSLNGTVCNSTLISSRACHILEKETETLCYVPAYVVYCSLKEQVLFMFHNFFIHGKPNFNNGEGTPQNFSLLKGGKNTT
jgi:hypothetical protein